MTQVILRASLHKHSRTASWHIHSFRCKCNDLEEDDSQLVPVLPPEKIIFNIGDIGDNNGLQKQMGVKVYRVLEPDVG